MDQDIPQMSDAGFNINQNTAPIIKVIGVGGGGNNAVAYMYEQNIENVSFVILNTDKQALNHLPVPTKVQIGDGLGAGNVPEKARKAAEEAADRIAELFDDSTKMVFITGGMGGGTGTGAAPVVARIAREKGMLTVGIITIPFKFEGMKKIHKAYEGVDEMSKYVDAILVINNQQLIEIYPDLTFTNAFNKADDTLTTAARSISELITSEGKINLDFNDVETTLRNGGAAIISTGYGEGEHRVTNAIRDALNSPLLRNTDILSSKKLLFNIYFNPDSEKPLTAGETDELTDFIDGIVSDVDVIWGTAYDRTLGDRIKFTILAAGFQRSDEKTSPKTHVRFNGSKEAQAPTRRDDDIKRDYGAGALEEIKRNQAKARYVVIQPWQMDNDRFIEIFEKTPAFNRDKKIIEELKSNGEQPSQQAQQSAENQEQKPPQPTSGHRITFS